MEQTSEPGVTVYIKIAAGLSEHALLWTKTRLNNPTRVFYFSYFRVILSVLTLNWFYY